MFFNSIEIADTALRFEAVTEVNIKITGFLGCGAVQFRRMV
jgi:hypothetical protein